MTSFTICGHAVYRPEKSVPSSHLDEKLGKEAGWVERKFGIQSRGVAGEHETSSFMGAAAAQKALEKAGWGKGEFDVLIGACGVMEQPIPSTSVLIQNRLGLGRSGIQSFDVNSTCLSFLQALNIALMGMETGRWRRALIVSSDIASAGLDTKSPEISAIFGDGAAAICIEASSQQDGSMLLSQTFETYGEFHELATLKSGGTKIRIEHGYEKLAEGARFEMSPFGIFKATAKHVPRIITSVTDQAGLTPDDLDFVICHQASAPAIQYLERYFSSRPGRVINIFPTFGNQIAASIPTALSYTLENNLVKRGNNILLIGTAAGISIGATAIRL